MLFNADFNLVKQLHITGPEDDIHLYILSFAKTNGSVEMLSDVLNSSNNLTSAVYGCSIYRRSIYKGEHTLKTQQ